MNSNFETKFRQNNSPDIGKVIDQSFTTFKKSIWVSGVGIILMLLLAVPITFFAIFTYMGISSLEDFVQKSETLQSDFTYLLMNAAIGIVLAALIAPVMAGFYKINHLAKQDKEFGVNNLFDYYKSPYFQPLALSAVLATLYSNIISLLLIYLNLPLVASIMQAFISLLFIFMVPLIIFENQNATDAMSNSSKIAVKHPFTIIVTVIFAFIIALLGVFAFCIGLFFTVGYFYTMNYTLYNEIIPIENKNAFDEIGQE
ncbi:hypothetical protein G6N05_03175 [Flavobacterium sp. F372]|uniref:DUF4013 domain-containing protein n=1 Tax=Flavobacterium bernardetii TaxID=2813823 RepID=A0ABR7IVT7_9FLAO|nr:hypothetical protein [Flavobacterium bernardetii]MBC5833875.1 hypothetical protein [Flavobacterium bernardetii]NHF69108.1 hypothetical protein [Flavobacterium bernardetii]